MADERTTPEEEYDSYLEGGERSAEDEPDVLLDVPVLKVEELDLELEDLRAHVSLQTELASLVKINVGVDAYISNAKLNIKGVDAQALLKVRLDRILDTFDRALQAIDNNPQILNDALSRLPEAADNGSGGNSRTPEATRAAGKRARELGIDLAQIEGTGARGRVVVRDVINAAKNR